MVKAAESFYRESDPKHHFDRVDEKIIHAT